MKTLKLLAITFLYAFLAANAFAQPACILDHSLGRTVITPTYSAALIENPLTGLQTTDKVRSQMPSGGAAFPTADAYLKFYWKDFEPTDGNYSYATLDSFVQSAKASRQRISLRLITNDELTSGPAWLKALYGGGWNYTSADSNYTKTMWAPDFGKSQVMARHLRVLNALAARYQNDMSYIDIGSVGLWGEWHFFATKINGTGGEVPMPSVTTRKALIDQYFTTFPNIPKIMQLQEADTLPYAVAKGAGIRGDCLGNNAYQTKLPDGLYEQRLALPGVSDAWKLAPVAFETCWTMNTWVAKGYEPSQILGWASFRHTSLINPKTWVYPADLQAKIKTWISTAGYRFTVEESTFPAQAAAGSALTVDYRLRNDGVAPNYYAVKPFLVLSSGTNSFALALTPIVRMLPGTACLSSQVTLPATIPQGDYTAALRFRTERGEPVSTANASSGGDIALGKFTVGCICR